MKGAGSVVADLKISARVQTVLVGSLQAPTAGTYNDFEPRALCLGRQYRQERFEQRLALKLVCVHLKMKVELEATIGGAAGTPGRSGTLEKAFDRPLLVLRKLIGESTHRLSL